jgi:hypothetical protein
MLSGLHSIGPLQFQASNTGWAFRPDAAESELRVLRQHHHDYRLDRRLGRRPPVQRELRVVRVRRLHFEPRALRLHVDLGLRLPRAPQGRLVPRPGRN